MKNYKELFYDSQAEIADIIDNLDKLSLRLKHKMQNYEDYVCEIEENRSKTIDVLNSQTDGSI